MNKITDPWRLMIVLSLSAATERCLIALVSASNVTPSVAGTLTAPTGPRQVFREMALPLV